MGAKQENRQFRERVSESSMRLRKKLFDGKILNLGTLRTVVRYFSGVSVELSDRMDGMSDRQKNTEEALAQTQQMLSSNSDELTEVKGKFGELADLKQEVRSTTLRAKEANDGVAALKAQLEGEEPSEGVEEKVDNLTLLYSDLDSTIRGVVARMTELAENVEALVFAPRAEAKPEQEAEPKDAASPDVDSQAQEAEPEQEAPEQDVAVPEVEPKAREPEPEAGPEQETEPEEADALDVDVQPEQVQEAEEPDVYPGVAAEGEKETTLEARVEELEKDLEKAYEETGLYFGDPEENLTLEQRVADLDEGMENLFGHLSIDVGEPEENLTLEQRVADLEDGMEYARGKIEELKKQNKLKTQEDGDQ